jgi:hypothetical protein
MKLENPTATSFVCCVLQIVYDQPAVAQWYKHMGHLPGHQVLSVPVSKDDGAAHVPTPAAADHEAVHAEPFTRLKHKVCMISTVYCNRLLA